MVIKKNIYSNNAVEFIIAKVTSSRMPTIYKLLGKTYVVLFNQCEIKIRTGNNRSFTTQLG